MISIRQLKYFDAVARLGHFGRAAEHCSVTQPALSMQVKELEEELGVQLLERQPKGVKLTDVGHEIAQRSVQILAAVRDLGDYARQRAGPLTGALRLGVIPSLAPYLLPPLLPLVQARYPDLDLHIRETQTEPLLQFLAEGALDLLLLALPVDAADIDTLNLFEDRFLLALPRSRRMKSGVKATPELFKNDRLLLLEEGHCLRDQALAFCQLRQVDHIDTFGASSLSTIVQMVANGMGLTLLPEISVDVEAKHAEIRLVRFADPQPSRTVGLAWRSSCPRQQEFEAFAKLIDASMTARASSGRRSLNLD